METLKEIFSKYKTLFIVLVVSVTLFVVYSIFFAGEDFSSEDILGSISGSEESVAIGREFLTVLQELKSLELNRSVFDSESFLILRDFSQEVPIQPSGRPNPFSPIGFDVEIPDDVSSSFDFGLNGNAGTIEFQENTDTEGGFEVQSF